MNVQVERRISGSETSRTENEVLLKPKRKGNEYSASSDLDSVLRCEDEKEKK